MASTAGRPIAGVVRRSSERSFALAGGRATQRDGRVAVDPTWPVFCFDDDDVIVVWTAGEVPVALDAVLVDEPVKLIDSKGRRLRKVISQPDGRRWLLRSAPEIIALEVDDGGVDDSELLRRTLTAYLAASGAEVGPADDIESFARTAARLIT